ncbi:MAG: polysaccharide deacetylase family protein, partial [Planctomycetes bacterium]|nr:polysaccharide deacetylase family protein [Planctomycetota bacterium]
HNGFLPKDMKIEGGKLRALLERLRRDCDLVTVAEGMRRLASGEAGRSMVALTMDDGYKDNRVALLPLLQDLGAPATIYLETAPLDDGRVNWSHEFFLCLEKTTHEDFVTRYLSHSRDAETRAKLANVLAGGERLTYLLKRVLKYEADPEDRDRSVRAVLESLGGDPAELCRTLYMDWDDARALAETGIELGGHTVHHHVLSTLSPERQRSEVGEGRAAMKAALGFDAVSFAYPFGRAWDWNEHSVAAARDAGFENAVTTHAGTNTARTDPFRLKRLMIDEDADTALIACEARGGFEWLRGFGVDLSE